MDPNERPPDESLRNMISLATFAAVLVTFFAWGFAFVAVAGSKVL